MKPTRADGHLAVVETGPRSVSLTVPWGQSVFTLTMAVVERLVKEFGAEVTDVDLEPSGVRGSIVLRMAGSPK